MILRRDLRRARWTLVLFLLLLIGEVAVFCSPQSSRPEAEPEWSILVMVGAMATWLVQFLLVTQLIHGDAPSRVGAQWRSRPFRASHLVLGKIGAILLGVFLPPWLAAQAARLAFGLRLGIGDYEGPLYHLALVSGFSLIAVVTTSTARAFLTGLGVLVGFGLTLALIIPSMGTPLASLGPQPIPTDVALSLALITLAAASLVNGYRKGGLSPGLLGIAWVCCLWFVLSGGPTPRPQPQPDLADASESFRIAVSWASDPWDDDEQGWYGSLRHVRTKPRRVVAEVPSFWSHHRDFYEPPWPIIVPADGLARIDGLGDVELVPSAESLDRRRRIGPLDPERFGLANVGAGFGDMDYTVRTYELLGRLRFDETLRRSDSTWSMRSVENPRRVEMRTLDPGARAGTFDPSANRLKITEATTGSLNVLWPIGAGVRFLWILNDFKSECVLLRETVVGKGLVSYEYLPMDVPPDWRTRPEA